MALKTTFTVFVSVDKNENPSIEGREYPPVITIPVVDNIFIPREEEGEDGHNAIIVYQPGNKTIFTDKTVAEIKKQKEFAREPIIMTDGYLFIDNKEVLMLEYLRACNFNECNKNRMPDKLPIFKERDKAQEAGEFLEEDLRILGIKNRIYNEMDPDELEALAMVLGDTNAPDKDTKEVQRDLIVCCNTRPDIIIEAMENTDSGRKVYIIRAFKGEIIEYDEKTNQINWSGGGKICDVPMGHEPQAFLLKLTGRSEHQDLLDNIKDMLPKPAEFKKIEEQTPAPPPSQKPAEPAAPPVTPPDSQNGAAPTIEVMDPKKLVNIAKEAGVIKLNGPWFYLEGTKKGDKYYSITRSNKEMVKAVREDKELAALIVSKLPKA